MDFLPICIIILATCNLNDNLKSTNSLVIPGSQYSNFYFLIFSLSSFIFEQEWVLIKIVVVVVVVIAAHWPQRELVIKSYSSNRNYAKHKTVVPAPKALQCDQLIRPCLPPWFVWSKHHIWLGLSHEANSTRY